MEAVTQARGVPARSRTRLVKHGSSQTVTALGLGGFAVLLWHSLGIGMFGTAFTALLLSNALSQICTAGLLTFHGQQADNDPVKQSAIYQHVIATLILRWLGAVVVGWALWMAEFLPLFQDAPGLVLVVLALGPILALVRITSMRIGQKSWWGAHLGVASLWILATASGFCAVQAGASDAAVLLGQPLVWGLLLLGVQLPALLPSLTDATSKHEGEFETALPSTVATMARHADLLAVAAFLPGQVAAAYLTLRAVAALPAVALQYLAKAAMLPLRTHYEARKVQMFRAAAARVNLGFLLIGGGAGLAALGAGQAIMDHFALGAGVAQKILVWLLVGQSAPALFGGTALMIVVAGQKRNLQLLSGAVCATIIIAIAVLPPQGAVELARMVALAQLSFAATGAIWVGRHLGVWPGITGVLYRQIKLT